MRLLLVEDEPRVAHFIAKGAREQGYAVDIAEDGEEALYKASITEYDLVILDLMLPLKDGFLVCKEMRAQGVKQPVLMLTARDAVDDRVRGLDCGADDYLTKPFEFKELLARIRALLRRAVEIRPEVLQVADLRVNTASHTVARPATSDYPAFRTIARHGEEVRVASIGVQAGAKNYIVAAAEPLNSLVEQLESIRRMFYLGFPAGLLVAGIGGFFLAKKSLDPVVAMSNQADRISARNLHERLSVRNEADELGHLARVFNDLLSRLDRSFESMRDFMADASHELRTPLSIIRGEADVALSQDRDRTEYKEALTIIQDEAKRLSRIVDDMLALARADTGQRPLQIEEFYLNDLVEECCKAARVLALREGVSLTLGPTADIAFRGDEDLLRRMFLNLLDNAIKYTPSGGSISVRLVCEPASASIIVSDTGIGIPADAVPHIFERFYRADKARSRVDGGSGLGLPIARWVAEAHNGSIDLTSRPGQGSKFTVSLPRDNRGCN